MNKKAKTDFAKKAPSASNLNADLERAVRKGDATAVQELLGKGASPNAPNELSLSPLHQAAYYDQTGILSLLLSAGAQVNLTDDEGRTPLMLAGDQATAILLLEAGAKVNAKDYLGNTPLMCAAELQNYEVVELLIRHGAKVSARNMKGDTALHCAEDYASEDGQKVVTLLQETRASKRRLCAEQKVQARHAEIDRLCHEGLPYDIPAMKPITFKKKQGLAP